MSTSQSRLKPLARGEMLGAFCLTEPHVGSEAGGLKTTAVRDGKRLILVINGLDSEEARAAEAKRLLDWGFARLSR